MCVNRKTSQPESRKELSSATRQLPWETGWRAHSWEGHALEGAGFWHLSLSWGQKHCFSSAVMFPIWKRQGKFHHPLQQRKERIACPLLQGLHNGTASARSIHTSSQRHSQTGAPADQRFSAFWCEFLYLAVTLSFGIYHESRAFIS